jgi:hypothetical protein
LALDEAKTLKRGSARGGRQRCGVYEAAGFVDEILDERPAAGDEASDASHRLAERAHAHVYEPLNA